MNKINSQTSLFGRANTILVFGNGDAGTAVTSSIIAHVHTHRQQERIRFVGPATFLAKTATHIKEVVLSAVDHITGALALPEYSFDICVSNLGAAALNDIGLTISGFSADASVLLALLSASLQIPVPDEIVSTGHIASSDGEIRMVKGIPSKLIAAEKAESIRTFIHPEVDKDASLDHFTPIQKEKIINALIKAKTVIRTIGVHDIGDLVQAAFPEEKLILASLEKGFFKSSIPLKPRGSAVCRAAAYFAENNEIRFWKALERQLIEGRSDDARQSLTAFTDFHLDQKTYPDRLGIRLFNLIQSLPPETRDRKLEFPLLPVSECIKLGQLAKEPEVEDVLVLLKAIKWDKTSPALMTAVDHKGSVGVSHSEGKAQLQSILSELDADTLTSLISLPIDNARAAYVMGSVVVDSPDEFNEIIASFYLHLLRHTRRVFEPADLRAAGSEGFKLLENAFSKKGGYKGALAEARNATNGGLRFVLDMMTEQLKRKQQEDYIRFVLKTEIDALPWESKVVLVEALLDRIKEHLPPEIRVQPPECFAEFFDVIVKAYVSSMDQVRSLFRSF